ncbi:M28 family peptidase [Nonlabens tegetincola]|uniref:M28 family peptidase n=1 Tax=Nonlabens tegetincola TaxID=323273 RepID=UPI000CF3FF42|nr:M28 family peptidase [Nonlabens tegetincola]PQJ20398.1 peptidase, M28 family protein [Nonlabens tegetincola]
MRPKSHFSSAISFVIILLLVFYAFYSQTPSSEVKENVPATEWSTARALEHIQALSVEPHYLGSKAHDKARDYIIKQLKSYGLNVTTQSAYDISWNGNMSKPENILARIKGRTDSKNALLLLSHYDSDPHSSKGASDAASGVATILEATRAFLAKNEQPENDIIICITDGEELGLNGASTFVNKHEWAQDVAFVLNFEARGSGGPSYMLVETNGGNRKIIEAFSKSGVEYPVANSLAYSIYKMIPNDTDLTIFREDGDINGLNFAFIGDHFDYHTELDSYERLDRNTLAHQGSYLMPQLDYFSSIDLTDRLKTEKDDDVVYVPLPLIKMVQFPFSWLSGLIIVAFVLMITLIVYGIKRRRIQLTYLLGGFVPFLGALIISYLITNYTWIGIKESEFYIHQLHGFPYNGYWLIAAAAFIALTISFFLYHKYYHRDRIPSLSVAPIFILWLICLLVAFPVGDGGILGSIFLPGAGFLIIPVFCSLIMLYINIQQKRPSYILLVLLSVPSIFILSPFIKAFPVALGMSILFVASVLTTLLFGLLVPITGHYRKKGLLAFMSLIITIGCGVYAFAKAEFSPSQPQSTSLVYIHNQDEDKAQWATYDPTLTDWVKEKLGNNPQNAKELNKNSIDSKYGTGFSYVAPAEYKKLASLDIEILSDTLVGEDRKVKLKVSSTETLHRIEAFTTDEVLFKKAVVNGLQVPKTGKSETPFGYRWGNRLLSYYIKDNEPLVMELTFSAQDNPELIFYGASFDLMQRSEFEITARPIEQMSMPFVLNDAVLKKRSIKLVNRQTIVEEQTADEK